MEKEADVKLAEEKRLKDTIEIVKEQIETITSSIEHLPENTTDPYMQICKQICKKCIQIEKEI